LEGNRIEEVAPRETLIETAADLGRGTGIYYNSRHDPPRTACALYDRCASVVEALGPAVQWDADPVLLGKILDHYDFALG